MRTAYRGYKQSMWYRDPIECIKELLGNPEFTKMGFVPRRIFKDVNEDGEGKNREYNEMCTADWWWDIHVRDFGAVAFEISMEN